jgi:prefoldin subunit 5
MAKKRKKKKAAVKISPAVIQKRIDNLQKRIDKKAEEIAELTSEIAKLKAQLADQPVVEAPVPPAPQAP